MANLNQQNPSQAKIGDRIKYKLVDPTDTTVYVGRVVAMCDYNAAKPYADVVAAHQAMLTGNQSLSSDISTFRFLIVECYDGVRRPIGYTPGEDKNQSWCESFEIIEEGGIFNIQLFDASSTDAALAIRVLREQGLSCKLIQK